MRVSEEEEAAGGGGGRLWEEEEGMGRGCWEEGGRREKGRERRWKG